MIDLSFDKLEPLVLTRFDHMFIHYPRVDRYRNDLAEEIVKGRGGGLLTTGEDVIVDRLNADNDFYLHIQLVVPYTWWHATDP